MLTLACLLTRARLWRYANNRLNTQDLQRVAAHLPQCAVCRREWEQTRQTTALLNTYRIRPLPTSQTTWYDLPHVMPVAWPPSLKRPYTLAMYAATAVMLLWGFAMLPFFATRIPVRRTVGGTPPRRVVYGPVTNIPSEPNGPYTKTKRRDVYGKVYIRTDANGWHRKIAQSLDRFNPGLKPRSRRRSAERPSDAPVHRRRVLARRVVRPRRTPVFAQNRLAVRQNHENAPQTVLMDVDGTLRLVRGSPHEQTVDATPETIVTRRYVMAQANVPCGKPRLVFRDNTEEIN